MAPCRRPPALPVLRLQTLATTDSFEHDHRFQPSAPAAPPLDRYCAYCVTGQSFPKYWDGESRVLCTVCRTDTCDVDCDGYHCTTESQSAYDWLVERRAAAARGEPAPAVPSRASLCAALSAARSWLTTAVDGVDVAALLPDTLVDALLVRCACGEQLSRRILRDPPQPRRRLSSAHL